MHALRMGVVKCKVVLAPSSGWVACRCNWHNIIHNYMQFTCVVLGLTYFKHILSQAPSIYPELGGYIYQNHLSISFLEYIIDLAWDGWKQECKICRQKSGKECPMLHHSVEQHLILCRF